jgi:hypothetical protein
VFGAHANGMGETMRFGDLMSKAKEVVDKRGGPERLKKDAGRLKDIAQGPGSVQDKAKRATEALKDQPEQGERGGAEGRRRPQESPGPDNPR